MPSRSEPSDMKRILRLSATQRALAWLIGTYLTVTLRTIRWDLYGGDHLAPFAGGQIVIAAFWHERLALMPTLWVKARKIHPDVTVKNLHARQPASRRKADRLHPAKIWCRRRPRLIVKRRRCEHAACDVTAEK